MKRENDGMWVLYRLRLCLIVHELGGICGKELVMSKSGCDGWIEL